MYREDILAILIIFGGGILLTWLGERLVHFINKRRNRKINNLK